MRHITADVPDFTIPVSPTGQRPLSTSFNIAVRSIAGRLFPCGFDVMDNAPATLDALTRYVKRTGRIAVEKRFSAHTIFACPETNYAFRAWHDWHHWKGQRAFDHNGEWHVYTGQLEDLYRVFGKATVRNSGWRDLLHCEVMGQLAYQRHHAGEFPHDQMAFTRAFLVDRARAVRATF